MPTLPIDETYIANLALGRIGEKQIMNMNDTTQNARWCKRFYTHTRDELLREHRWNFATGFATLSELAEENASWEHVFALPSDFLRLLQLNQWDEGEWYTRWEINGKTLLTNDEAAEIRYIRRVTDPNYYDPLFVEALSLKLAYKICKPITNSNSEMQALIQEYNALVLGKAERIDAVEARSKIKLPWVNSPLVRSRLF